MDLIRVHNTTCSRLYRTLTFLLALAALPAVFAVPSAPERNEIQQRVSQIRDGAVVSIHSLSDRAARPV